MPQSKYACVCSAASDSVAPWTVARQTLLSTGFSRQEPWSELPFPPPGHLPNSGMEPVSPGASVLAGKFSTTELKVLRNKVNKQTNKQKMTGRTVGEKMMEGP